MTRLFLLSFLSQCLIQKSLIFCYKGSIQLSYLLDLTCPFLVKSSTHVCLAIFSKCWTKLFWYLSHQHCQICRDKIFNCLPHKRHISTSRFQSTKFTVQVITGTKTLKTLYQKFKYISFNIDSPDEKATCARTFNFQFDALWTVDSDSGEKNSSFVSL